MSQCTDRFSARILIVDDQPPNVELIERILHRRGYVALTSTTNPTEVCELHRQNRYELIILDLQMPVMDGFEVMKALNAFEEHDRPAILVMSADPSQAALALRTGATSFLGKPFKLTDVLLRIDGIFAAATARSVQRAVAAAA